MPPAAPSGRGHIIFQEANAMKKNGKTRQHVAPHAVKNNVALVITNKQLYDGLARLEERWTKKKIPFTHAVARQLFERELTDELYCVLEAPVASGRFEDYLFDEEGPIIRVDPKVVKKWTTIPKKLESPYIRVTNTQINQAVTLIDRKWSSEKWFGEFRFTRAQIKLMVMDKLIDGITYVLDKPDESGTIQDLLDNDPRQARPGQVEKYMVG
jgi:hypothetical protein